MVRQRINMQNKSTNLVQNLQKRSIGYYGSKTYQTGMERMVLDKFRATGTSSMNLFALFGVLNLTGYGLSHVMSEKDYVYYFGYKGNGRFSDCIRSQFGCNRAANAWTAPFMIGAGIMM